MRCSVKSNKNKGSSFLSIVHKIKLPEFSVLTRRGLILAFLFICPSVANAQNVVLPQCGSHYSCQPESVKCEQKTLKFTRLQFVEFLKTVDFQDQCTLLYSTSTNYEVVCKINCIEFGEQCHDAQGECQPVRPDGQ